MKAAAISGKLLPGRLSHVASARWRPAVLLFLSCALSGCASAPPLQLVAGAEKVVIARSDPGNNYEIIGPVTGIDGKGCGAFGYRGSYERAVDTLRNNTVSKGGDYAQIMTLTEPHLRADCFDNQYAITANAYKKVRTQPLPTLQTLPAPPPVPNSGEESMTKKLRELKKLKDEGILTQEEFDKQKTRVLEKGF